MDTQNSNTSNNTGNNNNRFSQSNNEGNVQPTPSNASENLTFIAKADNANDISTILNTIHKVDPDKGKKKDNQNQFVICRITSNAITFIVEEGKHFQGTVSFKSGFFKEYFYKPQQQQNIATADQQEQQEIIFRINLSMILDCLSIFGHSNYTSVQFCYKGYGENFVLLLEDMGGDVVTHCSIKTMDADVPLEFDIITPVSNKIFIDSENLLEAFGELDYTSSSLNISLSPETPFFRLSTSGQMGTFRMDYCQKKKSPDDIFELYDLSQPIDFNFPLSLIKPCIKALSISKKTRLTLTQGGLLSFHHIVSTGGPQQHLVEFFILASSNNPDITLQQQQAAQQQQTTQQQQQQYQQSNDMNDNDDMQFS